MKGITTYTFAIIGFVIYAGGFQAASAAYRVECYVCDGSGRAALQAQGDER